MNASDLGGAIGRLLVPLSCFALVFSASWQRFGLLTALGVTAAVWLLAPYHP